MSKIDMLSPFLCAPVYQDYIWGGDRIPRVFERSLPEGVYAESWEIADRTEGSSTVDGGPLGGTSLSELTQRHGAQLAGNGDADGAAFPLLVKLIDAAKTLSVQVHPNNETAARCGGEPKTEMWYVLDATADAHIYCGLKPGTDASTFRKAIENNDVERLLNVIPVTRGDAVHIPGGLIHAIGAGCLLLEVQQNSNTTYRVYDWGRVGNDGKPRELHIEEALQVIRWEMTVERLTPQQVHTEAAADVWEVNRCAYFALQRITLRDAWTRTSDDRTFHGLFSADGAFTIETEHGRLDVPRGRTCLIPAACASFTLLPGDRCTDVLWVTR